MFVFYLHFYYYHPSFYCLLIICVFFQNIKIYIVPVC